MNELIVFSVLSTLMVGSISLSNAISVHSSSSSACEVESFVAKSESEKLNYRCEALLKKGKHIAVSCEVDEDLVLTPPYEVLTKVKGINHYSTGISKPLPVDKKRLICGRQSWAQLI